MGLEYNEPLVEMNHFNSIKDKYKANSVETQYNCFADHLHFSTQPVIIRPVTWKKTNISIVVLGLAILLMTRFG
jgi:hypothetical protein